MNDLEVVINSSFGGFSLDTEMALWLMENRGWSIDPSEYDHAKDKEYPINVLFGLSGDYFFHPRMKSMEFRTNKDLLDCVRAIKEAHKDDTYSEKYYGHIQGLSIVVVKINLSVENYHDGKEKVNCWMDAHATDED